MSDVLELMLSWAATTFACFVIVLRDEKGLTEAQLERAWIPTSRAAALVAFGQLAVLVHFLRTRRSLYGLGLGVFWTAVATGPSLVVGLLIDLVLPQGR